MKMRLSLIITGLFLASCTISTADISEVKMCQTLGEQEMMCASDQTEFQTNAPELYITTKLDNAPSDTKVTFTWRYMSGAAPEVMDSVTVSSPDFMPSYPNSSFPIPPAGIWPEGKYEVEVSMDVDNFKPIHKEFSIVTK